jgi:hypothetical protein
MILSPLPISEFYKLKQEMIDFNCDHWVAYHGDFRDIIYNGDTHRFFLSNIPRYEENEGKSGYHLCSVVKREVRIWLEKHNQEPPPYRIDYMEQCINAEVIKANIGKSCTSIDIDSCYWKTLYNLGFIPTHVFIKGLSGGDGWKKARNASIGSLGKIERRRHYIGDKELTNDYYIIPDKIDAFGAVRHAVISHVWHDIFKPLIQLISNELLMFFTDSVYVKSKAIPIVMDFLKDKNYNFKLKNYDVEGIDTVNKRIYWYDYEGRQCDDGFTYNKSFPYSEDLLIENIDFS